MVRSQSCVYPQAFPASPLFPSALSVNVACPNPVGVLRKTRSLTQIDPSAPLLSHRHSPHATIPFRITSFADSHHLTPIESYSCKKQGRGGVSSASIRPNPFPVFPQRVNIQHTATPASPLFSRACFTVLWLPRGRRLLVNCKSHDRGFRPCRKGTSPVSVLRITGHSPAQLSNLPTPLFHHSLPTIHYSRSSPRTSTLPPRIYGIIPPHRGSTRNPIRKRGGFSD
jgi:hypothetical protein